jgi:hypothetical protein
MDEIGVFTLYMSNEGDDDPSTKWERRRAVSSPTWTDIVSKELLLYIYSSTITLFLC